MTWVGVIALILGALFGIYLSFRHRSGVYFSLFVVHLAAALFYWQLTLVRTSDAWGYYNWTYASGEVGAGSWVIGALTEYMRESWEASYLDCFMVYHLTGFAGVVLLCLLTRELFPSSARLSLGMGRLAHCAVFLPSVHVWTSGIGKDSVMFFAIVAVVWGVNSPRRRFAAMLLGLLICTAVRPHVAALLLVSLGVAVASSNKLSIGRRTTIFVLVAAALVGSMPLMLDFVGLRGTDADTVSQYIEQRQGYNLEGGSSVEISEYPFPLQFFTYMYRPLFFDASSPITLVVSFENLLYLLATLALGAAAARATWGHRGTVFLRFNFVFWLLSTSIFALTTANLGIAVRQKTAVLPSFFLLILAAYDAKVRSVVKSANVPMDNAPLGERSVSSARAELTSVL